MNLVWMLGLDLSSPRGGHSPLIALSARPTVKVTLKVL